MNNSVVSDQLTSVNKRPLQMYRGRFAPSPSGHLHFGSLIAALASYLDVKSNHGKWLVRIEDIDPPREKPGASKHILNTLEAYGLHWDESVLYQSQQSALYLEILNNLAKHQLCYHCRCTRADIKRIGGIYQGHCRNLSYDATNAAIRFKNSHAVSDFNDLVQGHVQCNLDVAKEDFTLVRKDGLFAYQLAVVVDDLFQGITHVIRGCDLIEPTARQLSLFKQISLLDNGYLFQNKSVKQSNELAPTYGHVPLAVCAEGYKLSKQNGAPVIDIARPQPSLIAALSFLGQQPPSTLIHGSVEEVITWAISHWSLNNVPKTNAISISTL